MRSDRKRQLVEFACLSLYLDCSDIKEELLGVFNALFDFAEEQHCFASIYNAMVISQSDVHDRTGQDLSTLDDWANFGSVHAQDGALWHVDDRGAHHGAEDASIGDREGAT